MDWKEIAAKISSIAPVLGGAIGGPIGSLAGAGVQVLAKALGIPDAEATPDKLMESITGDPEMRLKLMSAENDFTLKMKGLEIDKLKAELADVQSARDLGKTGVKDVNLYILSYLFIIGFFISVILMSYLSMTGRLPKEMPEYATFLLGSLFGTLTAGTGAVIQYFFGSSSGSAAKSVALEKIAEKMK